VVAVSLKNCDDCGCKITKEELYNRLCCDELYGDCLDRIARDIKGIGCNNGTETKEV
jgi:hypothetical protein